MQGFPAYITGKEPEEVKLNQISIQAEDTKFYIGVGEYDSGYVSEIIIKK